MTPAGPALLRTLRQVTSKFCGDTVVLDILRDGQEMSVEVRPRGAGVWDMGRWEQRARWCRGGSLGKLAPALHSHKSHSPSPRAAIHSL